MSVANWKIIYRNYTNEELVTERARLKSESESILLSQATGAKSQQRSITTIEERLRALTEIQDENRGLSNMEPTYVDFS